MRRRDASRLCPLCLSPLGTVGLLLVSLFATSRAEGTTIDLSNLPAGTTQYHVLFVTSSQYGVTSDTTVPPPSFGDFGGVDAAEWYLTLAAASSPLLTFGTDIGDQTFGETWNGVDTIYTALLSTPSTFVKDRVTISGPVINTNGDLLALDASGLFNFGGISTPVAYDEFGTLVTTSKDVWTGSQQTGLASSDTCGSNWDDTLPSGEVGTADATGALWFSSSTRSCGSSARLYGLSPALTAPLAPVLGDISGDGQVDIGDFTLWGDAFGDTGMGLPADLSMDNQVDIGDFTIWGDNFGNTAAPGGGGTNPNAVPEPSTLVLLTVGLAALVTFAWRRSAMR